MKSRYWDNVGTSYAASIVDLLPDTAADSSKPLGLNAALNSFAHNTKFCLSLDGPALQFALKWGKEF